MEGGGSVARYPSHSHLLEFYLEGEKGNCSLLRTFLFEDGWLSLEYKSRLLDIW